MENKEDNKGNEQQNTNSQEETVKEEPKSKKEEKYMDFYIHLRKRIDTQIKDKNNDSPINKAINLLTVLPDLFHLNIKLLFDGKVKAEKKGAILAAILYVISPIDLIPDILPVFGWLDDLIVITLGLNTLFDDTKDKYIKKAAKKYWAGDFPVFELTHHIIDVINHTVEFLPRRIMKIVKDLLRGK
ncbi:MAG: YkvA family protein [Saprospiraceae bacterium]